MMFCLDGCVFTDINDREVEKMHTDIVAALKKKDEIDILESLYGCGNTSGTGDHTDLWVGVLAESELTSEELAELYVPDNETTCIVHNVDEDGYVTSEMALLEPRFEESKDADDTQNRYIIQYIKRTAFSSLDLRGA